jgi:hypothetical protein
VNTSNRPNRPSGSTPAERGIAAARAEYAADITLTEAAAEVGCSTAVLRHHIKKENLRAIKKGKTWLVTRGELDAFKANKAAHTPGVKAGVAVKNAPPAPVEPAQDKAAEPKFDSPAWQAKKRLEFVKEQNRQGAATYEQVAAAADAYIAEIKAWAKLKGVKVRLPARASLTR